MSLIYHITTKAEWAKAQKKGEYQAESLNTEGFIHCSTSEQVAPVANAFYREQKDLLLLIIDTEKLNASLRWEPPVHPAPEDAPASLHGKFPHIYGPLNLDAVIDVHPMAKNMNGEFSFPSS